MRSGQSVQSDLTDVGCMMRLRLISFEMVDGSFPIFSAMERKVSCWLIPVWMSIRSSRVRCFCFFVMRCLLTKSLKLNSSIIRRLRLTSSFRREVEVTLRSYESDENADKKRNKWKLFHDCDIMILIISI